MQNGELQNFGKSFLLPSRSCKIDVAGRNSKRKDLGRCWRRVEVWCFCTGDWSAWSLVGNEPLQDVGKGQGRSKECKFWPSLFILYVAVQKKKEELGGGRGQEISGHDEEK